MKDFEQLTDEEQQDVIMQIGSKLDKQEMWYWMGLVHLLRKQNDVIKEAIKYIKCLGLFEIDDVWEDSEGIDRHTFKDWDDSELLNILQSDDNMTSKTNKAIEYIKEHDIIKNKGYVDETHKFDKNANPQKLLDILEGNDD